MPAYNAEQTIARTIESILHQTDTRYKLIIINDGSTDHTEAICKRYLEGNEDKVHYLFQENRGLGGARNHGMRLVDTPYVSFLDSDDWIMPQYVEKIIWHLDKNKDKSPDNRTPSARRCQPAAQTEWRNHGTAADFS